MKITALTVTRDENEGDPALICTVTFEDGTKVAAAHPWRNPLGLWASDAEAREPAEICAVLRNFARSIEDHTRKTEAA